jgi:hypothetical protein
MTVYQYFKQQYRLRSSLELKILVQTFRGSKVYHDYNKITNSVFVHIPKTAGTSVQKSLFDFTKTGHFRAIDYRRKDPVFFDQAFKFCIVRNPYDRVLSAYDFLTSGGKNEGDATWAEHNIKKYNDFNEFVDLWLDESNMLSWFHFYPQHIFTHHKGICLVDYIGKMETLEESYKFISHKLGVDESLAFVNRTSKEKSPISEASKIKIRSLYKKDFEYFKYER